MILRKRVHVGWMLSPRVPTWPWHSDNHSSNGALLLALPRSNHAPSTPLIKLPPELVQRGTNVVCCLVLWCRSHFRSVESI
jgi:hypothetical protein